MARHTRLTEILSATITRFFAFPFFELFSLLRRYSHTRTLDHAHRMKPQLFLAVLCCVVHTCTGLVAKSYFTIQGQEYYDFVQFGFAAHGSISLSITTPVSYQNLSLYICTDKEFDVLSSYYDTDTKKICSDPSVCEHTQQYNTNVQYKVDSKNIYRIFTCSVIYIELLLKQILLFIFNKRTFPSPFNL
jgi:hypothetical protein